MRTVSSLILSATILLFAAGCSEPAGPPDALPISRHPSRTVVVDSTRMRLDAEPSEVSRGVYRFVVVGEPQEIAAGDVIAGVQGGGFLRRVTDVRASPREVVLRTEEAGLGEALPDGHWSASVAVPLDGGGDHALPEPSYTLEPGAEYLADGVTLTPTSLKFDNTRLFERGGCTAGGTCGRISFGIASGEVGFSPVLEVESTVKDGDLTAAHLKMTGTVIVNIDAYATIDGTLTPGTWTQTIATFSRPIIVTLAGIPVPGTATIELVGELTAEATGTTRINAGLTSSTTASVGVGWTRENGFYRILGRSFDAEAPPMRVEGFPRASFYFSVHPRVTVSLLRGVASSHLALKPYIEFELSPFPAYDEARASLDFGLTAEAGANFSLFDKSLGDYTYTAHIFQRLIGLDNFVMPRVPSQVEVFSGNLQMGRPGTQLRYPIVARVANAWGRRVPGTRVRFAVTSGGGSLSTTSVLADSMGLAQVWWTLGPNRNTQVVTATLPDVPGASVQFRATPKKK
ncbi:MAG TPA: hypothetical protein VFQ39_04890 [Longimicrobium sp.]|nr:hypothetical protein [Longimicrobium sp.]